MNARVRDQPIPTIGARADLRRCPSAMHSTIAPSIIQPSRPNQPRATTHADWKQRAARVSQRFPLTLGLAILLSLPMSWANAIEVQATIKEERAVDITSEPIVIESDAPSPAPGQDQLMHKFGEALGSSAGSTIEEHQIANGPLEITTRFGRLCAKPPPRHLEAGLGGEIALAAPCAAF